MNVFFCPQSHDEQYFIIINSFAKSLISDEFLIQNSFNTSSMSSDLFFLTSFWTHSADIAQCHSISMLMPSFLVVCILPVRSWFHSIFSEISSAKESDKTKEFPSSAFVEFNKLTHAHIFRHSPASGKLSFLEICQTVIAIGSGIPIICHHLCVTKKQNWSFFPTKTDQCVEWQ